MWEKEEAESSEAKAANGKPSEQVESQKKGKKKEEEEEPVEYVDRYRMDPLLVRRESTLLLLCLKAFKKRVIVFFNEKK